MSSLVGKILANRYKVDSFLGRGGMAEVYKVWDNQRSVFLAMKVLHQDMAEDRVFLRRFKREAQTLSRLDHPHIVRFHGLEQDGRLAFMLMEYVEGITLRTEIFDTNGKALSLGRIRKVMTDVCGALYYAHKKGMVHCDIKPANIMLDASGSVRLSDFGIARMTDGATATMVGAGTPAYMAPEQILGQNPVPQTDIYGLGVILYEMLTGGERPFTGEVEAMTGSTGEKIRWGHLNAQPPSPKKWNRSISPPLEAVVLKCLAKKPENRYKTPLELLNALGRAIGNVPPETYKPKAKKRLASVPSKKQRKRKATQSTQSQQENTAKFLKIGSVVLIALAFFFFIIGQLSNSPATPQRYPTRVSTSVEESNSFPEEVEVIPTKTNTTRSSSPTDQPTQKPQATYTPYPTNTPLPAPTKTSKPAPTSPPTCPGVDWKSQTAIDEGDYVQVCTKSDRLIVRKNYKDSGKEIIRVYPGARLEILGGPYCGDGSWWWEIIAPEGTKYAIGNGSYSSFKYLDYDIIGYVREGSDSTDKYFICP